MSQRCSCKAITTSRICRNKFKLIIFNKRYCTTHANLLYNKYALIIQKCWRSYRARCIVYKVYSKLPDEIQRKIMFYTRENYLIKKHHHNVIYNILDKRLDTNWLNALMYNLRYYPVVNQTSNLDKLCKIYQLYTKYYDIIPMCKKNLLYNDAYYIYYLTINTTHGNELAKITEEFKKKYCGYNNL